MSNINFNTYVPFANGVAVGTASVPALGTVAPQGLPTGPVAVYKIKPAAAVANAILPSVASYPSGILPIVANGGGVTKVVNPQSTYNNCLKLDVPRGLIISCTSGNSGGAATITVNGYDYLGQKVTKSATINALVANADVYIPTSFLYISSITTTATLNNVQIGTADIFGLPDALYNAQDVLVNWGGNGNLSFLYTLTGTTTTITNDNVGTNSNVSVIVRQAVNAGTITVTKTANTITITSTNNADASIVYVTIINPVPYVTLADRTLPQSAITTDTRGLVSLVDYVASNANPTLTATPYIVAQPADGNRVLTVYQYLPQVLNKGIAGNGQTPTEYVGLLPYSNF